MSTGTNNRTRVAFLPPEFDLPLDNPQLLNEVMNERERQTGVIVNQKENAVFTMDETVTSQTWFFEANEQRDGFRRMYDVPTLVAGGSVTIPHSLGNISGFTFTAYRGWVQNADGTSFRPIPADFIEVDPTDIVITVPGGSPYGGLSGQIVLEYIKG